MINHGHHPSARSIVKLKPSGSVDYRGGTKLIEENLF